jgi:hypothetical protein
MTEERINIPSAQDFVKPILCHELQAAGVQVKTIYQWVITNGLASLHTQIFDIDDYYQEGYKHIMAVNPPSHILPAFQIKDVEKLLPPYLLSRDERGYELSLEKMYQMPSMNCDRMPDVFARMVLECLKQKVLKAEECVKVLVGAQ